ncbi:hypothetical protein [Mycobacterium deserti]|uniref:Uncharacterized protein n=1 Tax=Mycobacterium deserti TaxID=2978347 RepID=A0ABT2MHJ1_9MYCO|nr:hypothetical protein [Mycobacterium deserti]MCT7661742.1 hypothetical protein [Mycobacterium deserti]
MMATFGLQRLESGMNRDTVSAIDVAEFLQQAEAVDVDTLARDGMGHALDGLHQRLHAGVPERNGTAVDSITTGLPTRLYVHYRPNTEFQPTRHANRV